MVKQEPANTLYSWIGKLLLMLVNKFILTLSIICIYMTYHIYPRYK